MARLRTGPQGLGWECVGWLAPGCHRSVCAGLIQSDEPAVPQAAAEQSGLCPDPGEVRGCWGGWRASSALSPLPAQCRGSSPPHCPDTPSCQPCQAVPGGQDGSVPGGWWCWRDLQGTGTEQHQRAQPHILSTTPRGAGVFRQLRLVSTCTLCCPSPRACPCHGPHREEWGPELVSRSLPSLSLRRELVCAGVL